MASTLESRIRAVVRQQVLSTPMYAQRFSRPKRTAIDPVTLAARQEFVDRWQALTDEGLKAGYLEWTNEYEGSHIEPVDATDFADGVEWTETEAEYKERVKAEVDVRTAVAIDRALSNISRPMR